jgi:putative hydrolase of the HAD superfamily
VTVVFLDALGTLVWLKPPAPRLRTLLAEEGHDVSEERAAAAFRAEISYYLEHHLEGSDEAALDDLRDRCAAVLLEALGLAGLDHAGARRAMLAALSFQPYPEVRETLRALHEHGSPLIAVSNWDCSLCRWLEDAGLLDLLDGVVSSGASGVAKPDPAIFLRALWYAGAAPSDVLHVGDSLDKDVAGARAARIRPVLLCRDGESPADVETIATLAELPSLL